MANVQPDKYIRIATSLFEAIMCARLPATDRAVFDFIIRKTYGFNKKHDEISASQIAERLGLREVNVWRAISRLKQRNMIVVSQGKSANDYAPQKDYDAWVGTIKIERVSNEAKKEYQRVQKRSINGDTHNKTHTKDNQKTTAARSARGSPTTFNPLGAEVIKAFEKVNLDCKNMYGNKSQRKACDMLLDTYGIDRVKRAITYIEEAKVKGYEYHPTITKPSELVLKWAALEAAAIRKSAKKNTIDTNRFVL